MLKRGGTTFEVAQILGHANTKMLEEVYGHLDDHHLESVVSGAWA